MKKIMNVILSFVMVLTIFSPLFQTQLYAASDSKVASSAENQIKTDAKVKAVETIGFEKAPNDEEKRVQGNYNSTIKFTKNTTMILDGNTTISVTSGNAIEIGSGIILTISLNGYTLNASSRAVRKAGIRVPSTSKLIVKEGKAENGQLIATGGPGTVPVQGSNGGDSDPVYADSSGNPNISIYGGSGGAGGAGGSAPGAGIGGNGGSGGSGGSSVSANSCYRQYCQATGRDGTGGGNALQPTDGTSGSIYLFGKIKVQATGGTLPSTSLGVSTGGSTNLFYGRGPYGGGGGGNGATAYGAAGIGAGGVGGGGGGAGGAGGAVWLDTQWTYPPVVASGGGGGGGQSGGRGGSRGSNTGNTEDGNQTSANGSSGSTSSGGSGGPRNRSDTNYWGGAGGSGGASDGRITNALGNTFVSEDATLNAYTSSGSSTNSAGNKVYKNKMVLLSECEMLFENADDLKYTGNEIEPKVILKDRRGNEIKPVANMDYKVSYDNNTDAGENTAKYVFTNADDETKENYLYVDGGVYPATFTIHPNDDPISLLKTDARMTYTYGESFQVTVDKHLKNDGTIKWSGELDDAHTGDAIGEDQSTAEVVPTKVGKLKLKATIIPDKKNVNGVYNFVELSASLDDDIQVNQRDIAESSITIPALHNYYYLGAQIQPHYTVEDGNSPIQFKTNKDVDHIDLTQGDDFTLEYGENLNVKDKGKVTIKGTGNYKGEVANKEFTVLARDINDVSAVSVSIGEQTFTGKDIFAKPVIKIFDNVTPESDVNLDYDSYNNDNATINDLKDLVNVGKKQITMVGTGNLSGQRTIDFELVKADIGKIDLEVTNAKDVFFDGVEIESRPTLKYNDILLTEDGTPVDTSTPIINPNDFSLSFEDIKEVGTASITISGMENFKGSKKLTYEVKQRPLHILPDSGQWKYYGTKDVFGTNQEDLSPTYKTYIRKLNAAKTEELKDADALKDVENQMYVKDNLPIVNYPIDLLGTLSREGADDIIANDKPNMTYKFTIDTLKLSDDTKKSYEVKLVDNQNFYKLESYTYTGDEIFLEGTLGKQDWYVQQPVNLVAPDSFTISKFNTLDVNDNPWFQKVSFDDGDYSKTGVSYFLRLNHPGYPDDGAITDGLNVSYKQDTKAPTGNLVINSDNWNVYNPATEFDFYLNGDANGMILAEDGLSLVNSVHYYIADKKMGKDELAALRIPEGGGGNSSLGESSSDLVDPQQGAWIHKSQLKMAIADYNKKSRIIYARIEDGAGNVTYVNSDGIVFDKDAPILKAEYKEDKKWTTKEDVKITGNVFDETSGLKDRYVAYQINDGALQIIETIDVNTGDFSIDQLKDGNYQVVISAWDKANNEAAPLTFHVMKDTEMPRILLKADTTTIAREQAITFSPQVGASDVAKLEVSYNDGDWKTVKGAAQTPYIAKANGTYTFRITNGAGVMSKESSITFTKIDTKAPKIQAQIKNTSKKIIEEKQYANSAVDVYFANAEKNLGDSTFEYQLDGGAWTTVSANLDREAFFTLSASENTSKDDMHILNLRITARNALVSEQTMKFGVDLTAPNVTNAITVKSIENTGLRGFLNDIFRNKKQQVTMSATDHLSGVNEVFYYIVKGNDTTKTLPSDAKGIEAMVKTKWVEGNQCEIDKGSDYIVYFKVSDHAGNISYGRSDRISIDDEAPQIDVTYANEGKWDHDPIIDVYVWDARPGVDQVRYEVYDGENLVTNGVGGESFTIANLNLVNGLYEVRIIATDKSKNESTAHIELKIDNDKPEIIVTKGAETERLVEIQLEAKHNGISGLRSIQLSKNGQAFEDIDEQIIRNIYEAEENGTYVFRAVSNAGVYSDEKTIVIDKFTATEETLKAVVKAKTKDNKVYQSKTWTNQEVTLDFSNSPANLNGLQYQLKVDDGAWQVMSSSNGYTTLTIQNEGKHHYEFKTVLLSNGLESNTVEMDVYLDKSKPSAVMKIKDISWSDSDFIDRGFSFDTFFDATQFAEVVGTDTLSDIDYQEVFLMKRSDLPSSFKGVDAASKIENLGKDKWQRTNRVVLDPNDSYVAFGKLYDKAGNVTYVSNDGTIIDDTAPTLTTDLNQEEWYKDNTTLIHFDTDDNLSEVKKVTYSINGGANVPTILDYGAFTISSNAFINGNNAIKVSVVDYSGNTNTSDYIAKKDTKAPTAVLKDETIVDAGKFVTKHVLSIEAKAGASGVEKVEIKTPDAGEWIDITSSYMDGFIADENGTYWLRVVNGAGNSALTSLAIGDISKDIPVITYVMTNDDGTSYLDGQWVKETVRVQFTNENANQVVERYEYKIDDGAYQTLKEEKDNSAIFDSIEGDHTYTMKLILDNGLESEAVSVHLCIDAIAPQIRINSDLTNWVKEDQELEVEVIDNESGVSQDGYSFDNGHTWQEENKAVIRANKIVGVNAKDKVSNQTSEKVTVDKIDSLGPTVETFHQVGENKVKTRLLEADIKDYKDVSEKAGSGIAEAYIMTSYPYKNGVFEANPEKTFDMDRRSDKWVTEKAVSVPYNGENDVWLVTEDNVGNMQIYSTKVTNMIGSGDDEGNLEKPQPIDPSNPSNPINPITPINPETASTTKKKSTNTSRNQTSKIDRKNKASSKESAKSLIKNSEDVAKLKELKKKLAKQTAGNAKLANKRTYVYLIPWLLVIVLIAWIAFYIHRYRRYKKKLMDQDQPKEV